MVLFNLLSDDIIKCIINDWIQWMHQGLANLDVALCNRQLRSTYMKIHPKVTAVLFTSTVADLHKKMNLMMSYMNSRNFTLETLNFDINCGHSSTLFPCIFEDDGWNIWSELKELKNISYLVRSVYEQNLSLDFSHLFRKLPNLRSCTIHCDTFQFQPTNEILSPCLLEEFSLPQCKDIIGSKELLLFLQSHCPKLKSLSTGSNFLPTISLSSLHHSFPCLETISTWIEPWSKMTIEDNIAIATVTTSSSPMFFPNLKTLELIINTMSMKQWEHLLGIFTMGCGALKSFTLYYAQSQPITGSDLTAATMLTRLCTILATNTTVNELTIHCQQHYSRMDTMPTPATPSSSISSSWKEPRTSLLLLSSSSASSSPTIIFSHLTTLTLSGIMHFQDSDLMNIAAYCTQLVSLNLYLLPLITDEGMTIFCSGALHHHAHLKVFSISSCDQLTDETFCHIMTSPWMQQLERFVFKVSIQAAPVSTFNTLRASGYWHDHIYAASEETRKISPLKEVHIQLPMTPRYCVEKISAVKVSLFSKQFLCVFPQLKYLNMVNMIVDTEYYRKIIENAPTLTTFIIQKNISYSFHAEAVMMTAKEVSLQAFSSHELQQVVEVHYG